MCDEKTCKVRHSRSKYRKRNETAGTSDKNNQTIKNPPEGSLSESTEHGPEFHIAATSRSQRSLGLFTDMNEESRVPSRGQRSLENSPETPENARSSSQAGLSTCPSRSSGGACPASTRVPSRSQQDSGRSPPGSSRGTRQNTSKFPEIPGSSGSPPGSPGDRRPPGSPSNPGSPSWPSREGTVAHDDERAREILLLHSNVANALVDRLLENDRPLHRSWLHVIEQERSSAGPSLEMAADYARYLSLALATGAGSQAPFHQPPPARITDAPRITDEMWSAVIAGCSLDTSWTDDLVSSSSSSPVLMISPKRFLKAQPRPEVGAICYMAAFSDMNPF